MSAGALGVFDPRRRLRTPFWVRLGALVRKEFRQLLRDPSNLLIGIGLPIVLILIFGYGMSMDVRDARLALVVEDRSPVALEALAHIQHSPYLKLIPTQALPEARALFAAHQVDGILHLPNDFSQRLQTPGSQAAVQLILDGGDPSRAGSIRSYVGGALGIWQQQQLDRNGSLPGAGGVQLVERLWFNAANNSTWYLVPGLIVLIMTLVGTFLTALVMAREWERGTLEALFISPVRPLEILLAKIIPYFGVGMLGLGLCLLAARFLFAVPLQGAMACLLVGSMLYMCVALGIGLLISAFTKNQFVASQIALLASFMPALMLSGFLFDLGNMPQAVHLVGLLLPATYFMELVKTLFLAGTYWPIVLKDCLILGLDSVLLLGLAWRVTRKRLD